MDQKTQSPQDIWDSRFGAEEYAYGDEPNVWFKQLLDTKEPGNLLLPAEGEGRNAVYAATKDWFVTAYDSSKNGIQKAAKLAKKHQVKFKYENTSHDAFAAPAGFFDCVALIYAHMPSEQRSRIHQKMLRLLKPGGLLIIEGFSVNQLGKASGGPKDADWLYTAEILTSDFQGMQSIEVQEEEIVLNEGPYHQGTASVIRLRGIK